MSKRQLKVLSVSTSDSSGGAARAAFRIHLAVRNLGIDSRMFVKQKGTDDPNVLIVEDFIPHNALYRMFDWMRNKAKNKWQYWQWNKYPDRKDAFLSDLRSTDIGNALQKIDFDILHLHWVNLRFLPLDSLPKDKPIVWTLHDSWPYCGVCHYSLDCNRYQMECGCCPMLGSSKANDLSHSIWLRKSKLYKGLDLHIVTPSRWLGECAKKSSLLRQFPISVIPNGLNIDVFRPFDETEISTTWRFFKENTPPKDYLLFGALNATSDKVKGFEKLISALHKLEKEGRSRAIELIVFGSDKPIEKYPTSIPIHYVGYISNDHDLASLYNIASVMVVPSLSEVFCQTASEALACGTPVVSFRCTGLLDVVDHNLNGYLADPFDTDDLAAGIIWCLDHNQDGALSIHARNKATSRFSTSVVGQEYAALFTALSKRH